MAGRRRSKFMAGKALCSCKRKSIWINILVILASAICCLIVLSFLLQEPIAFSLASECSRVYGAMTLLYKIRKGKTCSGISLKTQELTVLFLAVKVYCGFIFDGGLHVVFDSATLIMTSWVVYLIRYRFKASYSYDKELDAMPLYYLVAPAATLALLIHPYYESTARFNGILWAFSMYLESVSILPQLFFIVKDKRIETQTAHYVFTLGSARFLGFGEWIIEMIRTQGKLSYLHGSRLWIFTAILVEVVQASTLIGFCYSYAKSVVYSMI